MTGLEEFLKIFGDVTILQVVELVFSIIFILFIYKKIKEYFEEQYKKQEERDSKIEEALASTRKYPEYRQQSIEIQQMLQTEINEIKDTQTQLEEHQINTMNKLIEIEESMNKRECNKIRTRLLEYYRYYTSEDRNPMQKITAMEADAFWRLFKEYEEAGGNGYMHTIVQPKMNSLEVIDMDNEDDIQELMKSRK